MDQQVCYVLPPSSCVVPSSLRCSWSGDQVLPIFKRGWRRVSVSVFEGGGLVVLFLWISSGPNFPHSFLHFYRFLVLITLLSFSFFLHVAGHKVEPTVCFVVAVTIACFWCETGLQRARTKHRVSPYWTRCSTVHSGCCRFSNISVFSGHVAPISKIFLPVKSLQDELLLLF